MNWLLGLTVAALPLYLIRFSISGIPTTALEVLVYAVFIGWVIQLLIARRLGATLRDVWQAVKPVRLGLELILLSGIFATIWAANQEAALGAFKAWYIDPLLVAVMIVSARATVMPWLVGGLSLGTTTISLWGLGEFFLRHAALEDGRLNSVFGTPNYHALLTVPVIVLMGALTFRWPRWRWWLLVATTSNLAALILTYSYGGWIGLLAGVFVLLSAQPRWRKWILVLVVIVGLGVVTQINSDKFQRLSDFSGRSSSHVRVQIWQASWRIIQEHPWVGVGPNNFEDAYRKTIPKIVFPPLEWLVAMPHNFALAIAAQTGIIGLIAFAVALLQFFLAARRSALAAPLLAAMVALLIHGLVDTPYFKNDLAVVFWMLLVWPLLNRRREA